MQLFHPPSLSRRLVLGTGVSAWLAFAAIGFYLTQAQHP